MYNPFTPPKDYGDILDKLGWSAFFIASITFVLLNANTNIISESLSSQGKILQKASALNDFFIPEIILGFIVALIFRISKLHDRISDILKIRENFDINEALIPLAKSCGITIETATKAKLKNNRKQIMQRVFYKYASFLEPQIQKQLIHNALDNWHLFWTFLEASAFWFILGVILFFSGEMGWAFALIFASLLSTLLEVLLYQRCRRSMHHQIVEIQKDPIKMTEITQEFSNAL